MPIRWRILLLLFLSRMTMAFQFATIGAIAPLLGSEFHLDAVAIGTLIGIYSAPGIIVAIPGGAFANWLGDKKVVLFGLALMVAGSALLAISTSWELQTAGRLIAGIGGIALNVVMTKMVLDWFAGKEIATAMAVFVNSWPAGIAVALVVQPLVAGSSGIASAFALEGALAILAFVAMIAFYRIPDHVTTGTSEPKRFPSGLVLFAILAAGAVWGLFNGALAVVFSFMPSLLIEDGWSLAQAGASTSLVMVGVMLAGFAGGVLSDRTGRPMTILILATLSFATLLFVFPRFGGNLAMILAIGISAGLTVGPILTLPSAVLDAPSRAMGMGVFYTVYYVCFSAAPWISGKVIEASHVDRVFDFGVAMALLSLVFAWLCRIITARHKASLG
jgi:predicted MFS family arabinose efflux permease